MDHNFGSFKNYDCGSLFWTSKIALVNRNFGPLFFLLLFRYHPNEQNISVNLDQCPINLCKITVVGCNFKTFKSTVVERNFGMPEITVLDRNFGPSKITVVNHNFGPSKLQL